MSVLPVGFGSALGGYQIERSLRFNSADTAYLNRTPASASNRKTWTWSGWVKRTNPGTLETFFSGGTVSGDTTHTNMAFSATDFLAISSDLTSWRVTTQVFRDPSAWYHIVYAVDTTQATANNRIRIYVNGSEITAFQTTNNPSQNADLGINSATAHNIGRRSFNSDRYMNGYLTEVNFIDGSAKTPSDFGETDSNTGVWKPKAYSGTYGTNGFYLKFADNSGTTSTTLGKDSSGNGNNWTPNNFSVTAGAGNDSLVDTPTPYGSDTGAGGEVRGNYPVISPLDWSTVNGTLTNGNLEWTTNTTSSNNVNRASFQFPTTGKFYVEFTATQVNIGSSLGYVEIGISGTSSYLWWHYNSPFYEIYNGTSYATIPTISSGDVIQLAIDMDAGKAWYGRNNTWLLSGNPANGTAMSTPISFTPNRSGLTIRFNGRTGSATNIINTNFGQRPFAYTAPSGFKALCTQNLPTPTIGATSTTQANDYFNAVTYTGNGTSLSVTGVGFQPDLIWIKDRSNARAHVLQNAIAGFSQYLQSNATDAETTSSSGVTAVGSDGFTVGTQLAWNSNTETYVAWNWNAGGSTVTNTSGTISAQVRANTTSGFSIVTYTGTGANATVGHGLGVAPSMVIVKSRSVAGRGWIVWHSSLAATEALELNVTDAKITSTTSWNSTAPSSTVISLGTRLGTNESGTTFVCYAFAPVAGYSAFGSYTGNGSADGPFVYLGFRPRFVLIKRTDTAGDNWMVHDTARSPENLVDEYLIANGSAAEATYGGLDITANGFKIRTSSTASNASSATYIFAAFAESPFKYSLAR